MELDCRLLGVLLRAAIDRYIVKFDLSVTILEIERFEEVCDDNLAAERFRVVSGHASGVSVGCHVDVAGEKEHFSAHVNPTVVIGS